MASVSLHFIRNYINITDMEPKRPSDQLWKQNIHLFIGICRPLIGLCTLVVIILVPVHLNPENIGDIILDKRASMEVQYSKASSYRRSDITEFPKDFLSQKQRMEGGIFIHIFICLYIFVFLAIICNDYFVPSLVLISSSFGIKLDVAGATFMAIGSSAPTLFIAIVAVFFTRGDIGVGTVVGSTIFNTLFIIALSSIAVTSSISLQWYPLFRDSVIYVIGVVVMILVIKDYEVHWYEAPFFLAVYAVYIVVLYHNSRIEAWANDIKERYWDNRWPTKSKENIEPAENEVVSENEEEHETLTRFTPPETIPYRILWGVSLPAICLVYITIPNCREKLWKDWYLVTFTMSVVWMGVLSYLLVWMVAVIGYTFDVPDCVMGLTFLAVGTSASDAIASVFVARDGHADMAVSNCIASNVFDLLCLGFPWLLKTTIVNHGKAPVVLQSGNVYLTGLIMIGSMFMAIFVINMNNWQLNLRLGITFLLMYFIFLGLATAVDVIPCTSLSNPSTH